MIKKLYECGCFNYQKFILDNTKNLSLTPDEAVTLILVLDSYLIDKQLSYERISSKSSLSKAKLDSVLSSLLERHFYEIFISYDNGLGTEVLELDGFFDKVKAILDNKSIDNDDELFRINKYLTKELNRILTSQEIEMLTSLVLEDRYTLNDFEIACEKLKKKNKLITIKGLAQILVKKDEPEVKPSGYVKDFINSIK